MIILDLDNCVSDDSWRIPHIDWGTRDPHLRYSKYHALAPWDAVRNSWTYAGRAAVVLTSRPVMNREATVEWMRRAGIDWRVLLMRNNSDHRPSLEVKREQLLNLHHYDVRWADIRTAYDDRLDIVTMYRACGIDALQVYIHKLTAHWEDHPDAIRA